MPEKDKKNSTSFTGSTNIWQSRYFIWNKRILCLTGQWPYLSLRMRCFATFFAGVLPFSLLVPQGLQLVHTFHNIDAFVECFTPLITNFGVGVKLFNLTYHNEKLKKLLHETLINWERMEKYPPALRILQKHGEEGRFYTVYYMLIINVVTTGFALTPLVTVILDYVIPLNETRPHLLVVQADYKIDPDEYFYPILVHGFVACIVAMQVFVSNDTFFIILSKHACGMLEIVRYHLEHITQEDEMLTALAETDKRDYRDRIDGLHTRRIVHCITEHKRAIKYIETLESTCEWYLIILLALNAFCVSCTGARVVAKGTASQDVVRFLFFAIAQIVHLFCNTLPGHWILTESSQLQNAACNWYLMSAKPRRMIVLFLRRVMKPCCLTAGKMFVMSMENFSAVLQTSMSYFTLLTSTQ